VSPEAAREFLGKADFVWHQRFELAPGVSTPGDRDIEFVLDAAEVPYDLTGKSVLDIGTANGGAAFEAQRRGASRVVALDIRQPGLGSRLYTTFSSPASNTFKRPSTSSKKCSAEKCSTSSCSLVCSITYVIHCSR